jgi:hypothetical protein
VEDGGVRERRNGGRQAQSGKGSQDHVFHRNSPSIVGRGVQLRWVGLRSASPAIPAATKTARAAQIF